MYTADVGRALSYETVGQYEVMVLLRLGKNLEQLRVECGGRFAVPTVTKLALQMVGPPSSFLRALAPKPRACNVNNADWGADPPPAIGALERLGSRVRVRLVHRTAGGSTPCFRD